MMMKTFMFKILVLSVTIGSVFFTSCTEVENGERGVAYAPYGKGLNKDHVFEEGIYMGMRWLVEDMITYNVRQQTLNIDVELLDKNQMTVPITASIMLRPIPGKIGYLHEDKGTDYLETYCRPIAEGILKDVVGSHTAQELVTSSRAAAQDAILKKLIELYQKNHIVCEEVIIRDIGLPTAVSKAIEEKQVQEEKNLLAEKRKTEEENLAAAKIAKAKGDAEAKIITAKAEAQYIRELQSALASNPQYVELKKIEKWKGEFGTNNVFGGGVPFNLLLNK